MYKPWRRPRVPPAWVRQLTSGSELAFTALPPGTRKRGAKPCDFTTYHVSQRKVLGARDGSLRRPFGRIADALSAAEANRDCGVEIFLSAGTYKESIATSRHTRIVGRGRPAPVITGSLIVGGPHAVAVRSVNFIKSSDPAGAIVISAPRARVDLSSVLIERPLNHGIRQRAGKLRGVAVVVRGTHVRRTAPEGPVKGFDPLQGVAIVISGGASAEFAFSSVEGAASSGIVATGARTHVRFALSGVSGSGVDPRHNWHDVRAREALLHRGVGGVIAKDGAVMDLFYSAILGCRVTGVIALDHGAITVEHSLIRGTLPIAGVGGFGAVTWRRGSIDARRFEIDGNDFVGLAVLPEGEFDAHDGVVSRNPIGAAVRTAGFDLARILSDVRFVDNEINVDSLDVVIPTPGDFPF